MMFSVHVLFLLTELNATDENSSVNSMIEKADSEPVSVEDVRSKKTGRNSLCPCGSGKKHKKCCMN